jgi:hypothetical protein
LARAARKLHAVDQVTGELTCARCLEWERTYAELERKYRGTLTQIGNLRADKDREARQHEFWPKAHALFDLWKQGTGKKRARWSADRFWKVQPFLAQDDGERECRWALLGLLESDYHMKRGEHANRKGPKYDEFERPFASQGTFERFRDMGAPSQATQDFLKWYDALPGSVA